MPNPKLSRELAESTIKAVEKCVKDGFKITGYPSATEEAARRLGIPGPTIAGRLRSARSYYNLVPDKSKAPKEKLPADGTAIEMRRLRDEVHTANGRCAELERQLIAQKTWRSSILGLAEAPAKSRLVMPSHKSGSRGGRSVVLHLSDIHYGETVSLDEMDGVNRYDAAVARVRLGRFFSTAAALMTVHWTGKKPDEIVLCLGGDLISGLIHDELLQTNAPSVPATVREIGDLIAQGISALLDAVGVQIRVYSVPGNHGRLFHKPQSKGRAPNSLDLLATDFAEAGLRGVKRVAFFRSASPDAYFSTYGWHWLLTHGDTMGGKGGGTGFIGPMAAIVKGHRKLVDTSWRSGRPVHYVLTAHYHTTGKTSFGFSNGSVIGYGEYARDLRADPEPARQNMLTVHSEHGVINEQPLYLGHPSEGSLYAGPASVIRPQWKDDAA